METIYQDCRWLWQFALLWACLNLASSQSQGTAPQITRQINIQSPVNSPVLESGTYLILAVEAQGTSPLRYVWRHNDTVVRNDTVGSYRISGLNKSHSGVYRVTVENSYGKARSLPFRIVVKDLGRFPTAADTVVDVEAGKYVVLNMPEISYLDIDRFYAVEWQRNNVTIQMDDSRFYVTLDHNLAILNIPVSFNQSSFRVKFTHQTPATLTESYSQNFILSITEPLAQNNLIPPEFVIMPKNMSAVSSQNVKMECAVNGQPFGNIRINWYRNTSSGRTEITGSGSKYTLSTDKHVLTVNGVDISDDGIFECEGLLNTQPAYVPITRRATLTVSVPPSISPSSSPPAAVTKDFQQSVSLPCVVQGRPPPETSWYFNDVELISSNSTRYQIDSNGTLAIENVDLPDSGVYQCFGVNEAGESATYTSLMVNSAEPTMQEAPKNIVVIENADTSFTCKVKGGPQPMVYWKKDGVNITIGGRIRLTQDELLIGAVVRADSGLYSCNAVNIKGAISANATLSVVIKTQIIKPPQNMSRTLSTDVMLDCGVSSDPSVTPVWTWYAYPVPSFQKQNITTGNNSYHIYPNGSLSITDLQGKHSGRYECVVTSAGGNDQKTATLNVIETPDKPVITQVVLYDQAPNSVLINWTQSYTGNTPITKFIIESRRESSSGSNVDAPWETVNSNVNPSHQSEVIGNLLPSRYYRFRMIAVNQVGSSDFSDPAPLQEAIRIPVQPPSAAPVNVFCESERPREIMVTWEPPPESTWNGDLQGYIIYYKIDPFNDETEKFKNVSGKDVRQAVVENLQYYKKYRVRVAAYNEKGPGVNSSNYFVTTPQGRPDAPPQNVTLVSPTSTTVRVEWDPPPPIQINGANLGYIIDIRKNDSLLPAVYVPFDEQNPIGRQTRMISNLSEYTQYEIQVSCRTGAGAGPYSPVQTIRTLEDVPGPVAELKISNISDKSLRVNWKPPLELNGILTGYEISRQVKNSTEIDSINRAANATYHTFPNMLYETTYIISVRARTQVGFGPARRTEIVSGVPPELPGPPTRLAVTNIEARSVLLQFIPGFDGKTSITLWVVEAQVDGSSSWNRVYEISDPSANEITVYNLRPYTTYRLRIIAQNIVDYSAPSEPCNPFQTKQAAPGMPPQDISPRVNSSTSIRIRWMPVPRSEWNGDSLGYKILYRRWSKDVDVNSTSQSDLDLVREVTWSAVELRNGSSIQEYFLTNLEEWMDYEIQMMSFNAVGNSSASRTFSEKTDEDVPSSSPVNVMSTSKSSTTIFVSWSPVPILQRNGNIQGYKVKYTAQRSEPQYLIVGGANNLNSTLTGLRKFTNYSIQVLASTRMGDGVLSNTLKVMTSSDVPGPPVIIYFPQVNESAATIVWQSPEEPNGIIIMYRVSYKHKDEPDSVLVANARDHEENVFQDTIGGLDAQTYYIFSVQARTRDGWGEAAMVEVYTIVNRARPNPPDNVRVDTSEILSRSITIVWTPGSDNYGPIRNFTIQYRKRGEDWQTVAGTIKPQLTSYTIKGLQPNTQYSFRVAAFNDIGMSDFGVVPKETRTLPDRPDGAPQNVKIVAFTRTSIKITWEPPLQSTWNGQPVTDIIQFREQGTETFREEAVPFGQFNLTLQRLTIDVRYEIQVLTSNEAGRGPPSILQVFRVGDVAPFAPPSDIRITNKSSTELLITWKPPSNETTNGKITGYKVHYWESPTEKCVTSDSTELHVTELSLVLSQLKPYTTYCSTVQAVNIAGDGPQSEPVSKQTSEDLPSAPVNVIFRNVTLRELTILWDAPRTPNGKITQYQLQYFTSIDSEKTDVSTRYLPGDERQQYITDLLENQRYTFTLTAINSIGKGAAAEASIVTGPQPGSPEAPLPPVVTYKLKTIYLTWTNQFEGSSPIQGYHICYLEESKPNSCVPILDVNNVQPSAQISVGALKPGTGYNFVVRAINSVGISPPSLPSELYTTPGSLIVARSGPFHTQWWFLVIVALSGVIIILLIITLLCCLHKRRKKDTELKRSTTITTVMSSTPEPEENRFPALELRQSSRSVARSGKVQNNTNNVYARSPPRPSPASVIYSEGLNLPVAGASLAAARKSHISDDASSVLSEKPSNLGDSSDDVSSDGDDSSTDSVVKAGIPSSPSPPAFSSRNNRSSAYSNGARASNSSSSRKDNSKNSNPPWRFQNPSNAYAYTDSEADSSHYAFSLNNGNIVVNNVAGARTPLSGFSSFV